MSACNPLVFNNVTVGTFQNIAKAISTKYGFPVVGKSGTQNKYGFTITWNFASAQTTLTVQCLAYPSFLGSSWVNSDIESIAASFGLTVAKTGTAARTVVSVAHTAAPKMFAQSFAQIVPGRTLPAAGAPLPPGACSPLVFNNITISQFQSLAQAVAARYHIMPSGTVGTASSQGFTLAWDFNGTANTLTIQCMAHPAIFPCSLINSDIKAVASSLGLTAA